MMCVPETVKPNSPQAVPPADTWVATYGDMLFGYVHLRLRHRAVAEDLVQETFLAALKQLSNFSGQASFSTWLVGILKHKLIDYLRAQGRQMPVDMEDDPAIDAMFGRMEHWRRRAAPHPWRQQPQALVEQAEVQQALKLCIQALPQRYQQAFIMRVIDDIDTEEICKILRLNSNNLYAILHRARLRLRACLQEKGIGD